MATVYRAPHADLQHEVALKVPKLDGSNVDERKERCCREARSAVMLRHEEICRVFDLDEADRQRYRLDSVIAIPQLRDAAAGSR